MTTLEDLYYGKESLAETARFARVAFALHGTHAGTKTVHRTVFNTLCLPVRISPY